MTPTRPLDHATSSSVHLSINGERRVRDVDHRASLLDTLRDQLGLTGTKKGCDHGQCGACTVLVDGLRANSCLLLAVAAQGREITTIEGIAGTNGSLHPMQSAFLDRDAYQCGYCTPGQICSAIGVLDEAARGWPSAITSRAVAVADVPVVLDAAEVRERMAGNLCRCGAYANIVPAVLDVAVLEVAALDVAVLDVAVPAPAAIDEAVSDEAVGTAASRAPVNAASVAAVASPVGDQE